MWILDTNVISEMRVSKPNAGVLSFIEQYDGKFYTTSINIAEISAGIVKLADSEQSRVLETWLNNSVRPWFSDRVLNVSEECLLRWLVIGKEVQKSKGPTPPADLLIAAVAIQAGMKIVTRDITPFVACGVPTLNPWTGERFNGA